MAKQTDAIPADDELPRVATGSAGLDEILGGGLDANRTYLYEGRPGTGKTTIALQFLLEGARQGERVLYITMSETDLELRLIAKRHGWILGNIDVFELVPPESSLDPDRELTVLNPAEMELGETTKLIFDRVKDTNPTRVVIDSLAELRLLALNPLRYRRQALALKRFFASRQCTVILIDDLLSPDDDLQVHSITHGVVRLEELPVDYGSERRRLRVIKMRGIAFRGGFHDFTIEKGGLVVYPRLVASDHRKEFGSELTSSGDAGIDRLLGGGLERGTNVLFVGAAGIGKTSLALTFALAAVKRGENAAFFTFDEGRATLEARAHLLGLPRQPALDGGTMRFRQVDPAEMSPGAFAASVRHSVEVDKARVVVIDSLNGYLNAMPDERFLLLQMHELLSYLGQQGVVTILILAQHALVEPSAPRLDISYLCDSLLLMRYFEVDGTLHRAVSVVKKRGGGHEQTIRELRLGVHRLTVGQPLTNFNGILSGTARYTGNNVPLMAVEAALASNGADKVNDNRP